MDSSENLPRDVMNEAMMETNSYESNQREELLPIQVQNKAVWCPNCHRGIPTSVLSIHLSMCKDRTALIHIEDETIEPPPVQEDPVEDEHDHPATPETIFKSVPQFSLQDKITMLNKFEVLLLTKEQIVEFNKFFNDKNLLWMSLSTSLGYLWRLPVFQVKLKQWSRSCQYTQPLMFPRGKQKGKLIFLLVLQDMIQVAQSG